MTRKCLTKDIHCLNQRLISHQQQFQRTNAQSKAALKKLNPVLMIGAGLLAGVVTGLLGWRSTYTAVRAGFTVYPVLLSGINGMMGMSNDQ